MVKLIVLHAYLTFNFPWLLGYIRKLAFGTPWGNYFTPGFVCSQYKAPRNIKLSQTKTSHGTNSHLGPVEPRVFLFLYPGKFTLGQCWTRTADLSICSRRSYQWTDAPRISLHILLVYPKI